MARIVLLVNATYFFEIDAKLPKMNVHWATGVWTCSFGYFDYSTKSFNKRILNLSFDLCRLSIVTHANVLSFYISKMLWLACSNVLNDEIFNVSSVAPVAKLFQSVRPVKPVLYDFSGSFMSLPYVGKNPFPTNRET